MDMVIVTPKFKVFANKYRTTIAVLERFSPGGKWFRKNLPRQFLYIFTDE